MNLPKPDRKKNAAPSDSITIRPFNIELLLAREIIDRCLLTAQEKRAPVFVFGFDKIGQAFVLETAQMFHFPDLKLPRITVIDRDISGKWKDFLLRFPEIHRVAEITLVDINDWRAAVGSAHPSLVMIALPESALALDTARAVRQFEDGCEIRLLVVSSIGNPEGFPDRECCEDFLRLQDIEFVEADSLINGTSIIERAESCDALAMGIHYSWIAKPGEIWKQESLEAEWARLPDILRDSNRYAARHIKVKLNYLGWKLVPETDESAPVKAFYESIRPEQLELLGRMEHNRWMSEKYLAGYVPTDCGDPVLYKKQKDIQHRHINLVPWEGLSRDDQMKDMNILMYMENIVSSAGHKICPGQKI